MTNTALIINVFEDVFNETDLNNDIAEKSNRPLYANYGDLLNYYLGIFDSYMSEHTLSLIALMNEKEKEEWRRTTRIVYHLLLRQIAYETSRRKKENIRQYKDKIEECTWLLWALEGGNYRGTPEASPSGLIALFFGAEFAKSIQAMMDAKTQTIRNVINPANDKRLYWVWGSASCKTILSALPTDFFHTQRASNIIRMPDPYMGTLSWSLYYFRFGMNLTLLLKGTIEGDWMDETERKKHWTERFRTQWAQRKFVLLNDAIWATGNLLCFFWLNGGGTLGHTGDLLTLGLLIFDITLAVWNYAEQKTKYEADLSAMKEELNGIKKKLSEGSLTDETRVRLELKKRELKTMCAHHEEAWQYQNRQLLLSIAYAIGLMLAFAVFTTPFIPLAGAALTITSVTGAVLCFAFSVMYNSIRDGMELHRTYRSYKGAESADLEKEKMINPELDEHARRLLELQLQASKARTKSQREEVVLQTMHLVRSVILYSLIPAIVLVSLVFLPLGIGFGVMGAALAIAIASNVMINQLAPKKRDNMLFKEADEEPADNESDQENLDRENSEEDDDPLLGGSQSIGCSGL